MDNHFVGLEMSGFSIAFEAQINLPQAPALLLANDPYPNNICVDNTAANLSQGGADMAMAVSYTPPHSCSGRKLLTAKLCQLVIVHPWWIGIGILPYTIFWMSQDRFHNKLWTQDSCSR